MLDIRKHMKIQYVRKFSDQSANPVYSTLANKWGSILSLSVKESGPKVPFVRIPICSRINCSTSEKFHFVLPTNFSVRVTCAFSSHRMVYEYQYWSLEFERWFWLKIFWVIFCGLWMNQTVQTASAASTIVKKQLSTKRRLHQTFTSLLRITFLTTLKTLCLKHRHRNTLTTAKHATTGVVVRSKNVQTVLWWVEYGIIMGNDGLVFLGTGFVLFSWGPVPFCFFLAKCWLQRSICSNSHLFANKLQPFFQ